MAQAAMKNWEMENAIKAVDDSLYSINVEEQRSMNERAPWRKDPAYFKHVKISAIALLKMVMHARRGGEIEVMGVMTGKLAENTMVVMDCFALPVEASETRVNAAAEATEYMVTFKSQLEQVGKKENIVGWYHSHPGYGCWLSGIDVATQSLNQKFQDPFLAIVVDPVRTISAGKVEVGVFRTWPEDYKPAESKASEWQSVPSNKIEDFGVHQSRYYKVTHSFFKSSRDNTILKILWNKYWTQTLAKSPLMNNRQYLNSQIGDVAGKLREAERELGHRAYGYGEKPTKAEDSELAKVTKDAVKVGAEAINGLSAQVLKGHLFNNFPRVEKEGAMQM